MQLLYKKRVTTHKELMQTVVCSESYLALLRSKLIRMGVIERIGYDRYRIRSSWIERVGKWLSQSHIADLVPPQGGRVNTKDKILAAMTEPATPTEIARKADASIAAVVHWLPKLITQGLVEKREEAGMRNPVYLKLPYPQKTE